MFNQIIKYIKLKSKNEDCCEDNYIGSIQYDLVNKLFIGEKFDFLCNSNSKSNKDRMKVNDRNSSNLKIVLLLESPHIDEFNEKIKDLTGFASVPAWGKTGANIDNFLIKILNNYIVNDPNGKLIKIIGNFYGNKENADIDFFIVNSIQYQCSLGYSNAGTLKDFVFEKLWNGTYKHNGYKFSESLITRLKLINPQVIINCNTKNIRENICNKAFIHEKIKNTMNPNFLYCESYHPSKWSSPRFMTILK